MLRRTFPALLTFILLVASAGWLRAAEPTFFDSNGVKIFYVEQGEGEPVVLIHGFAASHQLNWKNPGIIDALSENYRVIAIDNRGHGKSDKPHDPKQYGVEMVNDVARLLDHLKIKKAHIVGYSMGGFITNKFLMTHPDRVITATLGGAGWSRTGDERARVLLDIAESLEAGNGITPLLIALTPAGRPQPSEQQLKFTNQMILSANDPKALAGAIRGMRDLVVTEEQLQANKVPALSLIGEVDPLKAGVDDLEGVMANLKIVVIKEADHMNAIGNPEFIGSLKTFLAEHSLATVATGK